MIATSPGSASASASWNGAACCAWPSGAIRASGIEARPAVVKRVLLSDSIAAAGEELLAREAEVVRSPDSAPATLRKFARDVDGLITRSKLPEDIFAAAPRLRAVMIHGTGTDLVPVEEA